MEINLVDNISMRIVVLDLSFGSHIENLNLFVLGARRQTRAIGIELGVIDDTQMVVILSDDILGLSVPHKYGFVVAPRSNQPRVRSKHTDSHPVLMAHKGELELFLLGSEHLQGFVVGGCEQQLAVSRVVH